MSNTEVIVGTVALLFGAACLLVLIGYGVVMLVEYLRDDDWPGRVFTLACVGGFLSVVTLFVLAKATQ